ncbi:MAG: hypothetical protein KF681_06095 [Bdellovibrionaceae bacterium]|nr:hypothetical protein [Pseudobdellovibrionaceae bacterium]
MTMNPLPPQAYTKETLVKAYQWLQHQNGSIKEIATNPDILVSLFLKAKLQGDSALERPSIQNFKKELKNLAGMIGEFEGAEMDMVLPTLTRTQAATPPSPPPQPQTVVMPPPPTSTAIPGGTRMHTAPTPSTPLSTEAALPNTASRQLFPELDTRSWLMIQEVKNQMNLSSELEALRLLISVGHTKLKSLMADK